MAHVNQLGAESAMLTDEMADELKDIRIPVMMAAPEVAAIDEWRRSQSDLPNRSEAIRRLVQMGLKAKGRPSTKTVLDSRD
jgi:hypothetical protein